MKASPACARTEPGALQPGGFVPLSTTDYPGALAAVVFCQGCPWACGYCHNPHLIPRAAGSDAPHAGAPAWRDILARLAARRGLLDAVVFSGGEPLLQRGLRGAMQEVRALGFKVGLHTGGAYPERLAAILPLCDWVGMDIKAPFARYDAVTGSPGSAARARASLEILVASGVAHECRTTVHRALHNLHELLALAEDLLLQGVECYVLQPFRSQGCRDARLVAAHDAAATAVLLQRVASVFPGVLTRPA